MKKLSYEYLIFATGDLYQRLDNAAVTLCSLKETISQMSKILNSEYEAKYKKPGNKINFEK